SVRPETRSGLLRSFPATLRSSPHTVNKSQSHLGGQHAAPLLIESEASLLRRFEKIPQPLRVNQAIQFHVCGIERLSNLFIVQQPHTVRFSFRRRGGTIKPSLNGVAQGFWGVTPCRQRELRQILQRKRRRRIPVFERVGGQLLAQHRHQTANEPAVLARADGRLERRLERRAKHKW